MSHCVHIKGRIRKAEMAMVERVFYLCSILSSVFIIKNKKVQQAKIYFSYSC